jgi:hypothetical protein
MKVATAALLLTSLGSPAWAQATLPDIDASKRMILAGRPQDAKVILDNLASLHPDSPDVLFLLADIAVSEQDYDRAIELYRRILVREPNLTRVRLELARTFFLVRDDETAEYHFRLAQGASDLPPEVAANIEKFLDAIRARKDWRIDLTVAAAPDTNINTGPDAEIVVIGGLPYRLSGTARRTSGLGLSSSLGGEYVAGLSDTIQMRAGGQIWRAEYSGDDFDDTIANGFAGPHVLFDQGEVSVLASGWRRWYAGEPYAYAFGARIEAGWQPIPRLHLQADLERLEVRYDDQPFRDGPVTSLDLSATYGLDARSFIRLIAGVERERTEAAPLRNTALKLGAGYYADLAYGFSAYVEPQVIRTGFDEEDFFFDTKREDHTLRVRTSLSNRQFSAFGFMPVFSYIYTRNWSNLDFYDYHRHQFLIGLTRKF